MVLLHQRTPSRKRPPPGPPGPPPPPLPSSKLAKSNTADRPSPNKTGETSLIEKAVSILAEAGCTLVNPSGPPCLPSDPHKLRLHLHRLFSPYSSGNVTNSLRSDFISGFSAYVQSSKNLRRVLMSSKNDGLNSATPARSESLVRHLLLVPEIQLDIQILLLEKLPEYFDTSEENMGTTLSLEDDVARLIINHLRWLDFVVDPNNFTEKLMQLLSICPTHLKKEIIGSLPEIIGNHNNKTLVDSLQQMLQEDSSIIVPVLDSFSNLNSDDQLQEQVITIALSCIRTIDAEHIPYLLRFLLLTATPVNIPRIISQIREHLKFFGVSDYLAPQYKKLKGKSIITNNEASVLNALRSCLRFKNRLCQEILNELSCLLNPQNHKVIDIWLFVLIQMNNESLQKISRKVFKKKVVEDCITKVMLDQCINGNKNLVQDYFLSFLSLAEYLLSCKEQKAQDSGQHLYISLFQEFTDAYSRQEVLGALITHVGSGVNFEVTFALETIGLLVSKNSHDLIPFSAYIIGILDYLEGFSTENLHNVYEVFSHLALAAQTREDICGSSIANELLMIVRKQINHSDMKYKQMGLIGILKIVSCIGDVNESKIASIAQKPNSEEALELLETSLDSTKLSPLPSILFYDELAAMLDRKSLNPEIMEWIGKHLGDFEPLFLSDLESGCLSVADLYSGLEGELWMNLDADISPVCLNILPLATSSSNAAVLQILPAKFLLLSTLERLTNKGSLGGIDALLGCPMYLPSSKYFHESGWNSLREKQKQVVCLSIYYAANWIRELLNAFSTQVDENVYTSQATRNEIMTKLQKRLRNLMFLESLLNNFIRRCTLSLPQLHLCVEHVGSSVSSKCQLVSHGVKSEQKRNFKTTSPHSRAIQKSNASKKLNSDEKLRQPTILDILKKAGALSSQELSNEDSSVVSSKEKTEEVTCQNASDPSKLVIVDISAVFSSLEPQRCNFRPLLFQCFSILKFSKNKDSCCADPAAELPLSLYLMRDLNYKLNFLTARGKQFSHKSSCSMRISVIELTTKVRPLFTILKKHLCSAISSIGEGEGTCNRHWQVQSAAAGNPDISPFMVKNSSVSIMVINETLNCFCKMLNLPNIVMDKSVLSELLGTFQPERMPEDVFSDIVTNIPPGSVEYLYVGAYLFVEHVLDIACSYSFVLASESLRSLELIMCSAKKFLNMLIEGSGTTKNLAAEGFLQFFKSRLRQASLRLLKNNWDGIDGGSKCKGDSVQKVLQVYLENSESTTEALQEIACSILPQISSCTSNEEGSDHGFPTLNSTTFTIWFRVLHEVNLRMLDKFVKEVAQLRKSRADSQSKATEVMLIQLQQSVSVVVSLVNLCKTYDKATVHAMALKYGGKFVDAFLRAFEFLQANFQVHNELIINLIVELQKATRTMQTLCSEAKGLRRTNVTSKIPAAKRSMERFVFHVKALIHTTPSRCTFWMGNLKHKDLNGQIVSSQAYVDADENLEPVQNQPTGFSNEEGGPTTD